MRLRSILSLALALALALAMTSGCAVAQTAEPAEVVVWHTFTNDQDATLNAIADEFNASQTAAKVVVQSQPYQDFLPNVLSAVSNGVGPNIIINYASTASDYVEEGLVADIGKYIDDPQIGIPSFKDSLPAALVEEAYGFVDGKMHAWPLVTTGPIFFYNKTLYDELGLKAPETWAELAENSKKIYEAKGIPGFAADSITDIGQTLIMQNGSGYIDAENKTILWNSPEAIERLEWYVDLLKSGAFALNPTGDYFSNDFNSGLLASYAGSCAGVPYITPDGFEYAVAPLPQDGPVKWYPAWNRGFIIFADDETAEKASYEFAKFYASAENNVRWVKSMIALSPYDYTSETESYNAFLAENPALAAVQANLPYAGFLPSVTGSATVRTELEKAVKLAAGGQLTIVEAVAEAEKVCNDALQGK
ncbi:MAG: extracellular solute-binding protein [Oscillospiraceae bacterium]|jgi:ABC-type glycerol-3-phosphate transport system substrate-binding protein|nr:extracellular solute-binding protein [Oscillospiraceae bacterium]